MKKRWILCTAVFLLAALFLFGCAPKEKGSSAGVPSIMVDGKLYYDYGGKNVLGPDDTVEDDQILGYISSVVSITKVPQKDGEANFDVMGAPYALWSGSHYSNVMILYYDSAWHVLSTGAPSSPLGA